ncbi:hypothetical protein RhiLY_02801 [Ceratobasidium sp. AG-Ba]|nr:hypothetical protein RhiLY_02801 [Ceratobasidium sp. AG-Ba]
MAAHFLIPRMSKHLLNRIRTHTHIATAPISQQSILESSPKPTATASGIIPGQAPFDNRESTVDILSEPEPEPKPERQTHHYSQRNRTRAAKAIQLDQETAERKAKSKRRLSKNPTRIVTSEAPTKTEHVSDSCQSRISDPNRSRTDRKTGRLPDTTFGSTTRPDTRGLGQPLLPDGSTHSIQRIDACSDKNSDVDFGEGHSHSSRSQGEGSTRSHGSGPVEQMDEIGESPLTFSTIDREKLEQMLYDLQHADPDTVNQMPGGSLRAILWEIIKDREKLRDREACLSQASMQASLQPNSPQPSPFEQGRSQQTPLQQNLSQGESQQTQAQQESFNFPNRRSALQADYVQPPRGHKAKVCAVQNPITVGGGHHLNHPLPGSAHRNIPSKNTNTDTESESETEARPNAPSQPTIQLARSRIKNINIRSLSSPSPLQSVHAQINPNFHHTLNFSANPAPQNRRSHTSNKLPAGQPLFRQSSSTPETHLVSWPRSVTSSISLGRPSHRSISCLTSPKTYMEPSSSRSAQAHTSAGASRPRGTAAQESSRAYRASNKKKNQASSARTTVSQLIPPMRRSLVLADTRHALRHDTFTSSETIPNPLPSPPELIEDNEEERSCTAAEARDEEPQRGRKKKPSARNIHGNEHHVLTYAKLALYAYAVREGAFQTRGVFSHWSYPVWDIAWRDCFPELPVEPPSNETIQIATFRGQVKDPMRAFVQFAFGFKKPALTPEDVEHNQWLYKKLTPHGFHYLVEPNGSPGYCGSPVPQPDLCGVMFKDDYNPVPLTAAAFSVTNMHHSIEEYKTGHFKAIDLNATDMLAKYIAHLRGFKAASRKAKTLRRSPEELVQIWILDDPYTHPVISVDHVRPDTPTTDEHSEQDYLPETERDDPESESDDIGRHKKRAKGKA